MANNTGNRKAVLLVALVFVLGIALGAVGTFVVTNHVLAARSMGAVHTPANTIAMFTRDLNLNSEQQKQIQSILSDTRAHYAALHDKLDPEYEQVRLQGRERIRQVLTVEQEPKYEDLLRQMDEDRRRRQGEQPVNQPRN